MKIGGAQQRQSLNRNLIWLALLFLVFAVGAILGERGLIQSLDSALRGGLPSDPNNGSSPLPVLAVDMPFTNYNTILAQREAALAFGVVTTTDADFVPAMIRWQSSNVPIRLRLHQGTAVHLGDGEKWNFEGRLRDDHLLLGMRRFYLLDPADNNWLNEWAFMQSLRREGILAPRYHFVRLILNGDDWGVYVLQEGAGHELITSQNRPEGMIVEFDAARWWQSLAYFEGNARAAIADPVVGLTANHFQYFEIDVADEAAIAGDDTLVAQSETAVARLRALQQGQLPAAAVFDAASYGRFLALVDLWGATEATSLVNLRLYYNPESDRLEPIAYNGNPLGSDTRISPGSLYHDPALQAVYVAAASRLSQPDYLQELRADLNDELQQLQSMLKVEADLALPWAALRERQEQMRRSLSPIQPVFAYVSQPESAVTPVIQVDVANALSLPLELVGFDLGGATFLEVDPTWIQGDASDWLIDGGTGHGVILKGRDGRPAPGYVRFHLPLTAVLQADDELDYTQEIEILVAARLFGRDGFQLTPARQRFSQAVATERNN